MKWSNEGRPFHNSSKIFFVPTLYKQIWWVRRKIEKKDSKAKFVFIIRNTQLWFTKPIYRNFFLSFQEEAICIPNKICIWNQSNMFRALRTHLVISVFICPEKIEVMRLKLLICLQPLTKFLLSYVNWERLTLSMYLSISSDLSVIEGRK